eukprot:UN22921
MSANWARLSCNGKLRAVKSIASLITQLTFAIAIKMSSRMFGSQWEWTCMIFAATYSQDWNDGSHIFTQPDPHSCRCFHVMGHNRGQDLGCKMAIK